MIALFVTFTGTEPVVPAELADIADFLRRTPGLTKAAIFTPATAHDPYLDDGPCPALMLECRFPSIEALEAVLSPDGHFQPLAAGRLAPSLASAGVTQQAMLVRHFPVAEPDFGTPAGVLPCTYAVAYEGAADDLNLWLSYYIAHHPSIMARFPGIRAIEICTRIDWCSAVPWPRADALLRNSVAFDDAAALDAALNSPVRDAMRADFRRFPPFKGRVTHFAMATRSVAGPSDIR